MNALGHAVTNDHAEMVEVLLSAGASPLIRLPQNERTFLHHAVLKGNFDICKSLLAHGADVSAQSTDSLSHALDFAINQRHDEIAIYLVSEGGANPFDTIGSAKGSPMSIMSAPESLQERLRMIWIGKGLPVPENYISLRPAAPKDRSRNATKPKSRAAVNVPQVPKAQGSSVAETTSAVASCTITPPPPPSRSEEAGGKECLVCIDNAINATFVHGDTSHTVCCYECATEIFTRGSKKCPMCNEIIEKVTRNFSV